MVQVESPATWDIYVLDGGSFGNQWRFEIYGVHLLPPIN